MAAPSDPSQSVPQNLIQHIHLVSTYRYPVQAHLNVETITKWLSEASKVASQGAPFFWTYIETPPIGTVYLTWQPLARLGTELASDGYTWAGPEALIQQEIGGGMILETYYHRAGYRYGEQIATHSRRRFRLVPPKVPGQSQQRAPDPSLWIVHWGPIESRDPVPVASLPFDPRAPLLHQTRAQLQRNGQIQRKEFMLADRGNWPQLPFFTYGRPQPMYAAPNNARGVPQQMAYPPQGHAPHPGPPNKRARHGAATPAAQPQAVHPEGQDDEEDTHRGDAFDHATPREVSIARYIVNHEWMEEVLSSPYRIGQINPADLGLGLKGSLGSMTEGIFEAQGAQGHQEIVKKPYTGHLDGDLADEFRKRVDQKIASEQSEIEKLTARHEKLMAKLKSNVAIRQAEQELRYAEQDGVPEALYLDVRQEEGEEGSGRRHHGRNKKVEDVVSQVETSIGRPAQVARSVERVQEGGYQEPEPEPIREPTPEPAPQAPSGLAATGGDALSRQPSGAGSHHSGGMYGDSDIDMGGTAAGLLDQMHTSSTSTPMNNFPTPQPHLSAIPSAVATPANLGVPSPQPARADAMEGVETGAASASGGPPAPGDHDWVMVPKGGISPVPTPQAGNTTSSFPAPATGTAAEATSSASAAAAASKPGSGVPTPADHNDFSSLGDINDYHLPTGGDAGDGMDLNMDMEDSAFGDAFHGVDETRGSGDGNTPADGGM